MATVAPLLVSVDPAKVGFRVPNDGLPTSMVRLKINNTMKVFKVKTTNPHHFSLEPKESKRYVVMIDYVRRELLSLSEDDE